MSELKDHIYAWLMELGEQKAANFLNECEIYQTYIDTLFSMDSDSETYMYDVVVNVPLKLHRAINEYSAETSAIETAITEAGQADDVYVRGINWKPYFKKQTDKKVKEIAQILSQEYVNKQIHLMYNSIDKNPHVALGISKELIETCCKHILNQANIKINRDWDVAKLVKETNKQIDLVPFEVENIEVARVSVAKILSGFSNIVHGITELRNSYGTGHGHLPELKSLDVLYIKLAVSASSELARFYLSLVQLNAKK